VPARSGPFYVIEIAQALARRPGHLEFDRAEARRIAYDMYDAFERGEFADEEVVARYGDPPRIGPIAQAAEEARRQGWEWEMHAELWYRAVALTDSAARRYIEGCGLTGAARLLGEWFGDTKKARQLEARAPSKNPPGPKPILREELFRKMLDDMQAGWRTPEELEGDTLLALSARYGGSQNTSAKARRKAMEAFKIAELNREANSEQC
jgi:hypothetical protein